ncbi:hypothetical protein L1887_32681 [Cichorium endivia]|nr:hypothetical protein L1887_32681 [Cichorium endivia]
MLCRITIRCRISRILAVQARSVHAKDPVAIYQVNRVLLPEAIFGTDIPPPAPAPAPVAVSDVAPMADGLDADAGKVKGKGFGFSSKFVDTVVFLQDYWVERVEVDGDGSGCFRWIDGGSLNWNHVLI